MLEQKKGKITRFCRWLPASTHAISRVSLLGTSLAMQNHTTVTLDQEQKEDLFDEVFNDYGDDPIPE